MSAMAWNLAGLASRPATRRPKQRRHFHHVNADAAAGADDDDAVAGLDARARLADVERRGDGIGDGRRLGGWHRVGKRHEIARGQHRVRRVAAVAVHADPALEIRAQRVVSRAAGGAVAAHQVEVRHDPLTGW